MRTMKRILMTAILVLALVDIGLAIGARRFDIAAGVAVSSAVIEAVLYLFVFPRRMVG